MLYHLLVPLTAGKGHETHQIAGTEKRPFGERAIVRELLAELQTAWGGAV